MINTYDGAVCVDCLMVIANGDTSGISDLPGWESRVTAKNATDNGRYVVVPAGYSDDDDDPTYFGKSPCDYCGDTLAGDRHPVAFIDTATAGPSDV